MKHIFREWRHVPRLLLVLGLPVTVVHATPVTTRVSVSSAGAEAHGPSNRLPSIGADGRFIVFASSAPDLVPDDGNAVQDVFLRDTVAQVTRRVSLAHDGREGNAASTTGVQSVSADGRYVAFESDATNLVPDDTNGNRDIFVRDTEENTTRRISVSGDGAQANGESGGVFISADGRTVAFHSGATNLVRDDTNAVPGVPLSGYDVFVHDLASGTTRRVSVATGGGQGNGHSLWPALSANGRHIAFGSTSSNLVVDDTNAVPDDPFSGYDVFLHDRVENTTRRVSVSTEGQQANGATGLQAVSADGRYVAFDSLATNLVAGDSNGKRDTFLRDTVMNITSRVSVSTDGAEGNGDCEGVGISGDGRYLVFGSYSSNLVPGDANNQMDIFMRDTVANTTRRVSLATDGAEAGSSSFFPDISGDGQYMAFVSYAINLVPDDANNAPDTFVRGPLGDAGSARYALEDVAIAMRAASGLVAVPDLPRLDVDDTNPGRLDLLDVVRIVRKVAGLEPNP